MKKENCPCHSGKAYEECCMRFHEGVKPENALALMRSRYAAYAKCLPEYIIKTTHPEHAAFQPDVEAWKKSIESFSKNTNFEGLEVLEFIEDKNEAYVTFIALLKHEGRDASFKEKSRFQKKDGSWLYCNGILSLV